MNSPLKTLSLVMLSLTVSSPLVFAASDAAPTANSITQPATGVVMHPEYAKTIARTAYLWGWPMVNMLNRAQTITKAPHPGLLGGGSFR